MEKRRGLPFSGVRLHGGQVDRALLPDAGHVVLLPLRLTHHPSPKNLVGTTPTKMPLPEGGSAMLAIGTLSVIYGVYSTFNET